MKVLFYAAETIEAGMRLQTVIEARVPADTLEVCHHIDSVSRWFYRPHPGNELIVVVLLAAGKQDLQSILSLRDLLKDVRILMVLTDREKETIAMAHQLRPRFIGYVDNDFFGIGDVLEKMLGYALN